MRRDATIAVIIPAFNEEQAIGQVIAAIPDWADDIVVADNGSTDRTAEVAERRGARVVREPRRGYGSACLAAVAALVEPQVVVFLDGDYSDHPEEMPLLVDPVINGDADLVIGSRVLGRCEPGALTPQARFGNWLSCRLMYWFWGVRHTDLGPFRAIRYDSLKRLSLRDPDYGWTVEMQVKAAQQQLRVREVPVSYRSRIGKSKVSGTLRGMVGAGTKILLTIFAAALESRRQCGTRRPCQRLVIFTRYPEAGKAKTRLIPMLGEAGAAKLQQDMTQHTLAWAERLKRSGEAMVEVRFEGGSEASMRSRFGYGFYYVPQGQGDLGARMARAAGEAFHGGADAVVMVGTDCPDITANLVRSAFEALRINDLVLGPAHDGGYYLIGLRRPIRSLFADTAWGTGRVLEETVGRATELGISYTLLQELRDVDRPEDLPVWQRAARRRGFSRKRLGSGRRADRHRLK
ncbi:MAG: TIGR04282 family arsenosugar biosynthesis glycosyltransferase [Phycisphaerae bacterium]